MNLTKPYLITISLFMFEDEINTVSASNTVEKAGYWPDLLRRTSLSLEKTQSVIRFSSLALLFSSSLSMEWAVYAANP